MFCLLPQVGRERRKKIMFEHLQAGRIEQRPASRIDLIAGVEKMPASLQHAREPLDIKRNDQPRTGKATSQCAATDRMRA
ncbi:hypothetical protein CV103_21880 [Sphingomonas fennica]|uniref:Uncharacterized protein n=1 Tax=Edaphosphingomonas fennica TaxID=114404 RepID=A0A2T4HJ09_9SPHN|nr:hypothetical protein CV103_21880 [Sphingomonas fennica]